MADEKKTSREWRRRELREQMLWRLERQRLSLLGADDRARAMKRPDLAERLAAALQRVEAEWERVFAQQVAHTNAVVAEREAAHGYA